MSSGRRLSRRLNNCAGGRRRDTCGGQLDRQRQTVEAAANLGDRRGVLRGQVEGRLAARWPWRQRGRSPARGAGRRGTGSPIRLGAATARWETPVRRGCAAAPGSSPAPRGTGRRPAAPRRPTPHRRPARNCPGRAGSTCSFRNAVSTSMSAWPGDLAHAQRVGDRRDDQRRVAQRRERSTKKDPGRKGIEQLGGDLQREARLADAAGPVSVTNRASPSPQQSVSRATARRRGR